MSLKNSFIIILILFTSCSYNNNPFKIKETNVKSVIVIERQHFNSQSIEHNLNKKQIKVLIYNLTNLGNSSKIKVRAKYRITILYDDSTMINLMSINDKVAINANDYYSYPENFQLEDLLKLN
jgi:uncharacterized membrane protein